MAITGEREEKEVEARSAPLTPVVYEVVRRQGEDEMARPSTSLWWSGVAAGLSISFSFLAQAAIAMHLPETRWSPLLVAAGYPIGFLMVILGRQQLFTETTITMVLPVMAQPSRVAFMGVARAWSIVLGANLAGTLAAALFCSFTPVLSPELLQEMLELATKAMAKPWTVLFFEAITAGFLMAAMVWMLPGAGQSQFGVIVAMTWLIAICGASHIVAGSIEAFMLVANGQGDALRLLVGFGLPALAGNIVGGTALFALISYAQVMEEI